MVNVKVVLGSSEKGKGICNLPADDEQESDETTTYEPVEEY